MAMASSSVSLRGAILQRAHLAPRPAAAAAARRAPTTRRRAVPAKISCIGWVVILLSVSVVVLPQRRGHSFLDYERRLTAFGLGRTPRASWARRRAATSRASSSAAASRGTPTRARPSSARCARRRSAAATSARCVRLPPPPTGVPFSGHGAAATAAPPLLTAAFLLSNCC